MLCCSAIVVCYAIRAICASFRHALVTENDIVFYNANVHSFPHPATLNNQGQNENSFPNYGKQNFPTKFFYAKIYLYNYFNIY